MVEPTIPAYTPASHAAVPDGWYPDPAGSGRHRWWENNGWTSWVSEGTISVEHPLPEIRSVPTLAEFPSRAALWGLGGAFLAILVSGVGAYIFDSTIGSLLAGFVGLYGATTLTVWLVSRRYGSGNLVRDIGLRFRWADVGAGFAASVAARSLGLAGVVLVAAARQNADDDPSIGQFDAFESSDLAIIVALLVAVFAAPLFEEIFFRGFLQATLETRLGPWWAIAITSVVFGCVHLSPDNSTTGNLAIAVATSVAGAVLGFAYWATRRLGTAIVGHAFFNLFAAVILLILQFG